MPHKNNRTRKILFTTLAVVIIAVVAGASYMLVNRRSANDDAAKPTQTINYDKPTEEEQKAGDQQKAENVKEAEQTTPGNGTTTPAPGTPAAKANLVISDAGVYNDTVEVRAYVTNALEDGTCTVTFSKTGQQSFSTTSTAFKDASTTQCGANDTPRNKFPTGGSWNLSVAFAGASGTTGNVNGKVDLK